MHTRVITRGLTIAGVAIGSALLIGALAVAMRGLAPVASSAAAKPATASSLRMLNRPAHRLVKQLASWHAPRVPKVHRHRTAAPRRRDRDRPAHRDTRPAAGGNHHGGPAHEHRKLRRLRQDDGSESGDD